MRGTWKEDVSKVSSVCDEDERRTYMVDAELYEDHHIRVDDVVFPVCPAAHACAAAGLVGVFAAAVELVVAVADGVDVVVGELGALVVETVLVGEDFLERRGVDFVRHGLAIDGVADGGVLDLESPVRVRVEVIATGGGDKGFFCVVAGSVRVEVGAWHWVGFVVDEAVGGPVEHGVYAEGEDVLVVGGEDAGVDDGPPRDFEVFVDGLGAQDAGCADFVRPFASLVEHEG